MVQFTLGCVLIALSLFFGIKEIMSNSDIISNRNTELLAEQTKADISKSLKNKVDDGKSRLMNYSPTLKNNLINQLNIDESKYDFELTPPTELKKAVVVYKYVLEGYEQYSEAVSLLSEIEKIKGLYVDQICLNCKIKDKKENQEKDQDGISFKIEGSAYVYNSK